MTVEPEPVEAAAEEPDDEEPSPFGGPGIVWAGDGALSAGRPRERSPLDVAFEIYPPAFGEGDDGYPLATFNRRWIGFLVDQFVIIGCSLMVTILAGLLTAPDATASLQWAAVVAMVRFGYGLIFNPRGWSPGKIVVGLRIVNEEGDPPGLRWGVMRTAGAVLSEWAFYLGYLWALFDSRSQTLHDRLAKTFVVRVEESERVSSDGWRRSGGGR